MKGKCDNCHLETEIPNDSKNEVYRFRDEYSNHVMCIYCIACPTCGTNVYSHLDGDYYEPTGVEYWLTE